MVMWYNVYGNIRAKALDSRIFHIFAWLMTIGSGIGVKEVNPMETTRA